MALKQQQNLRIINLRGQFRGIISRFCRTNRELIRDFVDSPGEFLREFVAAEELIRDFVVLQRQESQNHAHHHHPFS